MTSILPRAARRRRRRRLKPRKQRKRPLSIAGIVGRNVRTDRRPSQPPAIRARAFSGNWRPWLARPSIHTHHEIALGLHAAVIGDSLSVFSYSDSGYCKPSHDARQQRHAIGGHVRRSSQNDEHAIWHMTSLSRVCLVMAAICKKKKKQNKCGRKSVSEPPCLRMTVHACLCHCYVYVHSGFRNYCFHNDLSAIKSCHWP